MPNAITAKDVVINFGQLQAVAGVSFNISAGSITMIIGPNGSGKTTLLKAIASLLPFQGEIEIFGKPVIDSLNVIGYVPQHFSFDRTIPLTVQEFLTMSSPTCFSDKCDHGPLYKQVGVEPLLAKQVGELSGGQLQRVLIARALLDNPKVLLLDEPASGIDIEGQQKIHNVLKSVCKKNGTTIVMISHEVELVNHLADNVLCLNKKLVCSGRPQEVLSDSTLKELYGEHTTIYHHHHD